MSTSVSNTQLQTDKAQIMSAYRSLMRACTPTTSKSERKLIREAFEYSMRAHEGARRKSGEPYILHPLAVAKIVVKEIGLDATSVVCALLHDVVEDTYLSIEDIQKAFGNEVAGIIEGLTKIAGVFDHKSSAQAENFKKMLLTLSDDIRVILIKLADRLHNMRTLQHMKKESQLKIASETLYLYGPLAGRLGLYSVKTELEDLSLKYTEPGIYLRINAHLKKFQRESRYYIKNFMHSIRERLAKANFSFEIKHRYKSIYSIYSKMSRRGIPLEEVYDIFAVRIILDVEAEHEKSDCFRAYSLVTELYRPNPERLRDWITIPKSNGYESLHVTVMGPRGRWIEVQIRTTRMDNIAERGMASHWRYKENGSLEDERFVQWLGHVRELLETPNMNAVDLVREFKSNLEAEEVFAFTPKGDLIQLPTASTVLDFAYTIHSNIGDHCIGAKVNMKVVPLSHVIRSGDQVEIITSKKQHPQSKWLEYVKTSRARHKIKEALRKQRKAYIERGSELFFWSLDKVNVKESDVLWEELITFFQVKNKTNFLYLLGKHELSNKKLQEFIELKKAGKSIPLGNEKFERKGLRDRAEFERWLKSKTGVDSDMLMIGEDMDLSHYKFAPCCQPIPGDDILGFWDPDKGLAVHRTNCKEAIRLMSTWGKNIIKAKWTEISDVTFLAGFRIIGEDRQGMMDKIIRIVSGKMRLNIRSITIDSNDGMFEGLFKIFVKNTEMVHQLTELLRDIPGVFSVNRMEQL